MVDINNTTILITGCAGFIGSNLILRLLKECHNTVIIGVDNLNNYYDVGLKESRIENIQEHARISSSTFYIKKLDIADKYAVNKVFAEARPSIVVNLAAQAGVRYSIENPAAYISSNLVGFYNILEGCRLLESELQHFIYASSSSVYGGNRKIPFNEDDRVDNPISLYAATKKSNELLAYSYSELYDIPSTGLRFFTVYGPAGRPDMAYFLFTEKLRRGERIKIFNFGNCQRDFTYIDDIVEGIICVMQSPPKKLVGGDGVHIPPYEIYNIGNSHPENLMDFVHILSEELVRAEVLPASFNVENYIEKVPMQPGDVPVTYADMSKLEKDFGYKPKTALRDGLSRFSEWYKEYYEVEIKDEK